MKKFKIGFIGQIVIGLVLGVLVGILLNGRSGPLTQAVDFFGNLYLNALRMMIYPMIFCSVVVGITAVRNMATSGKIALKALIFFVITTLIASVVGVFVPRLTELGVGTKLTLEATEQPVSEMTGILDLLVDMVPSNPFTAFTEGNVLQILVFAIVVGFAMLSVGEKAEPVKKFFISFNEIAMKVVSVVMKFTPFGVFFLIIPVVSKNDFSTFTSIIWSIIMYYIVCVVFVCIVFLIPLKVMGKAKVGSFLKKMFPAIMMAFSTQSSSAALPVSQKCMDDAGIRKEVSSLVLPMGCTMNMNGSAIVLLMMITFYCNACGVHISSTMMVSLITVCLLTSIGAPAIPNGGVAAFTALVVLAGLPGGVMALFFSTCALTDMGCTAVNVLGDLVCCKILDTQQNESESRKKAASESE